jgi:tRNA modification GTPase
MKLKTTIVATATPKGRGAIGIVRLSGSQAFFIAAQVVQKQNLKEPRQLLNIYNQKKQKFDQALVLAFKEPFSFTGENLVEFHCHGSPLILQKVIDTCIFYGACLAAPGEFSQRAFLNGKLDLTQAEAIMDLIEAKSERLLEAATSQLGGNLKGTVNLIQAKLTQALGLIHGPLDFPIESEEAEIDVMQITNLALEGKEKLKKLLQNAQAANIFRQGLKTVILGEPNVGKSSLLNLLLQQERAIVSDEPGTTRDFLSEEILIRDIPILLIDTAGLRDKPGSKIEQSGIEKSLKLAEEAELILFVFDAKNGLQDTEKLILQNIQNKNASAKLILLANKADLGRCKELPSEAILFSVQTAQGLNQLEDEIESSLNISDIEADFEFALNMRQASLLKAALDSLETISIELPVELISVVLQETLNNLEQILGQNKFASDRALEAVFSNFCIGK